MILNVGAGRPQIKPTVTLQRPRPDIIINRLHEFPRRRISASYELWKGPGSGVHDGTDTQVRTRYAATSAIPKEVHHEVGQST